MATTTDYFLQGFNSGANVAGEGLRLQELKSQAALRRMQEARAARELDLMVRKYDDQVQQQADLMKAAAKYDLYRAPVIPVPNISGGGGMLVPNPMKAPTDGHAFVQAFLPLSKDAGEAQRIAQTGAMIANKPALDKSLIEQREAARDLSRAREGQVGQPPVLAPETANLNKARTDTEIARQEKLKAETEQVKKGKSGVTPEFLRTLAGMEEERGRPFTPEEKDEIFSIHLGTKSRQGTQRPPISKPDYVSRQLPSVRRADADAFNQRSDKERITELEAQYDQLYGDQPSTEVEMIWVIDPNGKRGRIPKPNLEKALKQGYKIFEG